MNPAAVKRAVLKACKRRGYVVQLGALEPLIAFFSTAWPGASDSASLAEFLEAVLDAVAVVQDGSTAMLDGPAAAAALERVAAGLARAAGGTEAGIEVVDIFALPGGPSRAVVDGRGLEKAEMFRRRYELLHGKTLRNPRFTPPSSSVVLGGKERSAYLQLTAIDSLRGTKGDRLVLGMLAELEEGCWFLEDLNGSVEVDLSEAHVTPGMHTESSFVIAQGRLVDDGEEKEEEVEGGESRAIFKVFAMGTPPMEERDASKQALGKDADLFGGHYNEGDEEALAAAEKEASDAMFVAFSDVFLDNPRVIAGLRLVFEGYLEDDNVPTAVILMGSFLSHPFGQRSSDIATLTAAFTALGDMIVADFPQLAQETSFVIVPGPADAGPGNFLPRPPLPAMLTAGFVAALSAGRGALLASNPCRLRYMTQEIVFFREDLLHKMLRSCAVAPNTSDTSVMSEHMIKSVVDQAHLCPLPLASRPVLWAHDQAMWLFPAPHLVVIADKVDGYNFTYGNTIGMNPGSFGSDLSFAMYALADRKCTQCSLDPTELAANDAREVGEEDVTDGAPSEDGVPSEGEDDAETGGQSKVVAMVEVGSNDGAPAEGGDGSGPKQEDADDVGEVEAGSVRNSDDDDDEPMAESSFPPPGQLDEVG